MASIKQQIDTVLNTEMDRKEFLRHIAIGLVAFLGFGSLLRVLLSYRSSVDSEVYKYGGNEDGK